MFFCSGSLGYRFLCTGEPGSQLIAELHGRKKSNVYHGYMWITLLKVTRIWGVVHFIKQILQQADKKCLDLFSVRSEISQHTTPVMSASMTNVNVRWLSLYLF